MVDALDSKSGELILVWVQVPPRLPSEFRKRLTYVHLGVVWEGGAFWLGLLM